MGLLRIFGSDGALDSVPFNSNVRQLQVRNGTMKQVCRMIWKEVRSEESAEIIISAGAQDITPAYTNQPSNSLSEDKKEAVIDELVYRVITPLKLLVSLVKKKRGTVVICSLLPRPQNFSSEFSEILSQAYVKCNKAILKLNKELKSPQIWLCQKLVLKNQPYKSGQRRVKSGMFEDDKVSLTERGKTLAKEVIIKVLKSF
jgi:hypothetical protein